MILQYRHPHQQPTVFCAMTGLSVAKFDALTTKMLPYYQAAEHARLSCPHRQRAIGGGRRFTLPLRDHLLLTIVWLRRYPTNVVLGSLALRTVRRMVPLRETAGQDTMRLPDPGCGQRRDLDALLA